MVRIWDSEAGESVQGLFQGHTADILYLGSIDWEDGWTVDGRVTEQTRVRVCIRSDRHTIVALITSAVTSIRKLNEPKISRKCFLKLEIQQ